MTRGPAPRQNLHGKKVDKKTRVPHTLTAPPPPQTPGASITQHPAVLIPICRSRTRVGRKLRHEPVLLPASSPPPVSPFPLCLFCCSLTTGTGPVGMASTAVATARAGSSLRLVNVSRENGKEEAEQFAMLRLEVFLRPRYLQNPQRCARLV